MSEVSRRFAALPKADLDVLRVRAQVVARTVERERADDAIEVLEVPSRGQTFALPLNAVEGISDLSSVATVPRAPPFVRGLVSFRGEVLIGIELSLLVGATAVGIGDLRRIICLAAGGMKIALLAEKSIRVRDVSAAMFRADPVVKYPFIVGTDSNFVALLDPGGLLTHVRRAFEGETA